MSTTPTTGRARDHAKLRLQLRLDAQHEARLERVCDALGMSRTEFGAHALVAMLDDLAPEEVPDAA